MSRSTAPSARSPRAAGFSVIELTVSLAVTVLILLAVLQIFDFSSKLSRVQSNVSDMQQSQRVAAYEMTKMVRMAGRGHLPAGNLPGGFAVSVTDNVPANTTIGGGGTPTVATGTDILTIRGAFTSPVYMVNAAIDVSSNYTYNSATQRGTVRVDDLVKGYSQDLSLLVNAINKVRTQGKPPDALLLVSNLSDKIWAVVELDQATSQINLTPAPPTRPNVVLGFRFIGGTPNNASFSYLTSSSTLYPPPQIAAYPPALIPGVGSTPASASLSRVSILEEYRYYLRQEREIPGDNTSEMVTRLSRAQVYPNTNMPYDNLDDNWKQDLTDNVLDLQVALGVNTTKGAGIIQQGGATNVDLTETANGNDDDWLYNDTQAVIPNDWLDADLYYVRVSTLVRTDKRDNTYEAPLINAIENHSYSTLTANTDSKERMFRRRVLRTVIDLRNL